MNISRRHAIVIFATAIAVINTAPSMRAAPTSSNGIAAPALSLLDSLVSANRNAFYLYRDSDSGFNHGFFSGWFVGGGASISQIHVDTACVYDANSPSGCSTSVMAVDISRGTVTRVSFDPLPGNQFAGVNIEEPENWGAAMRGTGYDLRGAGQVCFDAVSPANTPRFQVRFGVGGRTDVFRAIPAQWTSYCLDLAALGLSATELANTHNLFTIVSGEGNAVNGGTVLLDNIRFEPPPDLQNQALSFPLANEVFGVVPAADVLLGRVPIPPDQIFSNLTTIYESSMAALTLLSSGANTDAEGARSIADAFVYALSHDNQGLPIPAAADGSTGLHNGYSNGDLALANDQAPGAGKQGQIRLSGFSIASNLCGPSHFCLVLDGATGGNNAFAMLALIQSYNKFQDPRYLNAARTIGAWIYGNLRDPAATSYGGYFLGYPDRGQPKLLQTGKSVENNADIFRAFTALADLTASLGAQAESTEWSRRAKIAGDFVIQMFDTSTGHFFAGTLPAGIPASPGITPAGPARGNDVFNTADFLDAQSFTTLAVAGSPLYKTAIDWHRPVLWMLSHYTQSVTAGGRQFQGFDLVTAPTSGPNGIAWEFTGQAVVLMRFVDALYGDTQFESQSQSYLNQIRAAQLSAPFGDGQGVVAATLQAGENVAPDEQCLSTPFQCIAARVGLAATTWAIAADLNVNPFQISIPAPPPALPGKLGVYRAGTWFVDHNGNNRFDSGDLQFLFGVDGDIPVYGDWDHSGTRKIGIYRNGFWYVDYNGNGQWDGPSIDRIYNFGVSGDIPVVGDWDGSGQDKIGIYRAGSWYVDWNGNNAWDGTPADKIFLFGVSGDIPVVGDWDGSGRRKIGIFRNGSWYLDWNGNNAWDGTPVDRILAFGVPGDLPVVGDWKGSGRHNLGVYRNGSWYLDYDGSGTWDGPTIDRLFSFGVSGDKPIAGNW